MNIEKHSLYFYFFKMICHNFITNARAVAFQISEILMKGILSVLKSPFKAIQQV